MKNGSKPYLSFIATVLTASCVLLPSAVAKADSGATITIIKNVVNDNGGTAVASDFTLTLDSFEASPNTFSGDAVGISIVVSAGSYSVSELPTPGYTASFSSECSGTVIDGDSMTCTVTNDDDVPFVATTGTVIVIKNVINGDGGDLIPSDFNLGLSQYDGESTSTQNFAGSNEGTVVTVDADTYYEVSEDDAQGYEVTYSEDCMGTVAAGETKTCTVTNENSPSNGTIIIIKDVINDNGGQSSAEDFDLHLNYYDGESTSTVDFTGDTEGTEQTLPDGTYFEVTEDSYSDYEAGFSEGCSGTIMAGETITCTVTNDDVIPEGYGTVTVYKHVVNRYGLNKTAADFYITLAYQDDSDYWASFEAPPSSTSTISFNGDEAGTMSQIPAGYFEVTENTDSDYSASYSEGCSGVLGSQEEIVCTITNTAIDHPSGGPGWTPGILEPYNPFTSENPEQPQGSSTPDASTSTTGGSGLQPQEIIVVSTGCVASNNEAVAIVGGLQSTLALLGQTRDMNAENRYAYLLDRITSEQPADPDMAAKLKTFIVYGTPKTLTLGAGERAGVLNSYFAAYGHWPADACDWQDVLKIAKTTMPRSRASRELDAMQTFSSVFDRDARVGNTSDTIVQSVMGYGIRPEIRDLEAERKAILAFRRIYGRNPISASDWDINRAMAYGGLSHPWLPGDLAFSPSRILSIQGMGSYFALSR